MADISERGLFNKLDAISTQLRIANKIEYLKLVDKYLNDNDDNLVGYNRTDWCDDMEKLAGKMGFGSD